VSDGAAAAHASFGRRSLRNPEHLLRTEMRVPRRREDVFAFFGDPANLGRITPPELDFRILTPPPIELREGTLLDYRLGLFGVRFSWRTRITRWNPPFDFEDTQLSGPYAQWIHRHVFRDDGAGTVITDEVRYRLPVPILGVLGWPVVRLQLARIFSYRQRSIAQLLG
jgi:ligand-binding SRPBCC domain-containing protein